MRLLHRAFWPFCTFAYAVNRRSAARILREFGTEKEGGVSAFDVQLLEACRNGSGGGKEWKCWSVVPEIFHHTVSPSEIGRADAGVHNSEQVAGQSGSGVGKRIEVPEWGTWNLECGARHSGLWIDENGPRKSRGWLGG
ncbi:hypothetical protein EK21DRAFT_95171 [Setomelanomma holmii]|uniref:Uncharacterized protein n=1 Tax=Setomelanomma holmii TaxID=210430 RepID=A0A9P4GUF9_9PLEO|nr:hypothetical protein EK21DRAFT_95171 [Setomelanomma holmii]